MRATRVILAAALACVPALALANEQADAAIRNAMRAMGGEGLRTIRYSAAGLGYTFGQAYSPGMPWPKIDVHALTRTIDYETASMRQETTLSRAEPRGGGGYPQSGRQSNDQYVSGAYAWNVSGGTAVPGARFAASRAHELWITPHGVLKAALRNNPILVAVGPGLPAISFAEPHRFSAIVYLGADGLVQRVASRVPDPVLGEVTVVTSYSSYQDFNGVRFPRRIEQSAGGFPVLDVLVTDVKANIPVDIAVPDAVKSGGERVTADRIAEGVWFLAGGSHNSVAIEMRDYAVLVEAPLDEARTAAVIAKVRELVPGKALRYVVNSHAHFDHSGGLRTAAAQGATIVALAANAAYFRQAFGTPLTLGPDILASSGKAPQFVEVGERHVITDGARAIEVIRIAGSVHSDAFAMVYLPREMILIEADAYTPSAPGSPPPATPNVNHVNLVENIERDKLAVETILPLHGRVAAAAELYAAAKAAPR